MMIVNEGGSQVIMDYINKHGFILASFDRPMKIGDVVMGILTHSEDVLIAHPMSIVEESTEEKWAKQNREFGASDPHRRLPGHDYFYKLVID